MIDGPSEETLNRELDQVFNRHNDLIRSNPAMATALLLNMADNLRDKFNLHMHIGEIADVDVDGIGVIVGEEDAIAFLGVDRDEEGHIKGLPKGVVRQRDVGAWFETDTEENHDG